MSGAPPVNSGALHVRAITPSSFAAASTLVGAPGTTRGVAAFDSSEYPPMPATFFAATLKVYATPISRPLIFATTDGDTPSVTTSHNASLHA